MALCLEGRLTVQTNDLHAIVHDAVGGEMASGSSGSTDPMFWFAHAANDLLRLRWQQANQHLRPYAYGYPAKSAYNITQVGLYDPLGMEAANGTGAFAEATVYGGDASEPGDPGVRILTAADVLCGPIDALYTYDVLLGTTDLAPDVHIAPPDEPTAGEVGQACRARLLLGCRQRTLLLTILFRGAGAAAARLLPRPLCLRGGCQPRLGHLVARR